MNTDRALAVTAKAGDGILMEVKSHLRNGNSGVSSKIWPVVKASFFSSVMLWMLYKWYKKQQLANVTHIYTVIYLLSY